MTDQRRSSVGGVRLVTERMPHMRSASIGLWVAAGSRDDAIGGEAHLLEHVLFKGTSRRTARDIASEIDLVGGDMNAYSTKEYTCYYARVLESDVELAVDLLCDMFTDAQLREADVVSERSVVLEELAATDDLAEDLVGDLFAESVWPDHALGSPITGTPSSVAALSPERLRDFYAGSYSSANLVVAAAGSIEHASLERLLADRLPAAGPQTVRGPSEPPRAKRAAVYRKRPTEQVHLVWGGQAQPREDPDRFALAVLGTLYGGGMSSRLFQQVREERGLVYTIYFSHSGYSDAGMWSVYASATEPHASEVLKIVRTEAGALASGDVTEQEVVRAKGHVCGNLVLSMDDPGGRMGRLGKGSLLYDEPLEVDEMIARVQAVDASDVTRLARRIFCEGDLALASVGPLRAGSLDWAIDPLEAS